MVEQTNGTQEGHTMTPGALCLPLFHLVLYILSYYLSSQNMPYKQTLLETLAGKELQLKNFCIMRTEYFILNFFRAFQTTSMRVQ